MSNLVLASGVKESLNRFGLSEKVTDILGKAAIVSHPQGNRRYHNWVFNLVGNTLVSVSDIRLKAPVSPGGRQKVSNKPPKNSSNKPVFVVWEECPECEGPQCPVCGGRGEVKVTRHGQ
jgi:hypothetical protein